jgi:hypothetical protein
MSNPGVLLRAGILSAAALLPGCGGESDTVDRADLPAGWESAERVAGLVQLECEGSPYEGYDERVAFQPGDGSVVIEYSEAHFRCAQDVEGFVRGEGGGLDVLVQPIDMDPDRVAACDCLYDITIELDPVTAGEHAVTVYRRWDNLNEPNDPVEIGSGMVLVR